MENKLLKKLFSDGYTASEIKEFLLDGEALKLSGYTDEDQELIEEAYDEVEKIIGR